MAMTTRPRIDTGVEAATAFLPRYHVILLDDDDHTYEYVIEMLGAVFGFATERAYQVATEVDAAGRSIIYTGPLEVAELKQQQVHAYGADWRIERCVGSMTALIETAPS